MYFNLDLYICICCVLKYHVHILFFLNSLSKPQKMRENLYVWMIYDLPSKIEDYLKDIVIVYRGDNLLYI
jgi:hypothetical protein